jgi:hypothetical protein
MQHDTTHPFSLLVLGPTGHRATCALVSRYHPEPSVIAPSSGLSDIAVVAVAATRTSSPLAPEAITCSAAGTPVPEAIADTAAVGTSSPSEPLKI